MKKVVILFIIASMFLLIKAQDVIAAESGWSSSWEEYGDLLAAHAKRSKTSVVRKKDVPSTKVYHDGKNKTTLKCEGITFDVKADKTLGAEYRVKFMEIYPKINTGLSITVKMDTASFTLDKNSSKGYWKIIVETKGYEVFEKVQKWDQSVVKARPEGVTIYSKTTKYAPAKKNSAYKVVQCN